MRLCTHCNGWGRWSDADVEHGAPALRQGVCGRECGYCKGDGMNLGVECDTPEEQQAAQAYVDLVHAALRVARLQADLIAAEDALNAECVAAGGGDVEAMRTRLGIPSELLARAHWARRP